MTPVETFIGLADALAWPLLIVTLVLIFRPQLTTIFDRIVKAKLPGGAELTLKEHDITKEPPRVTLDLPAPDSIKWGTGDLYWLSHYLTWATAQAAIIAEPRDLLIESLRKAHHHARAMELGDVIIGRLWRLLRDTETSLNSDWTEEKRDRFADETLNLFLIIEDLAQDNQPGFVKPPEE